MKSDINKLKAIYKKCREEAVENNPVKALIESDVSEKEVGNRIVELFSDLYIDDLLRDEAVLLRRILRGIVKRNGKAILKSSGEIDYILSLKSETFYKRTPEYYK